MAFCFFSKARFVQKSNAQYFWHMLTICHRFRRQCRLREVFDCVRTSLCIKTIAGSLWSLCRSHPAVIKVFKYNSLQRWIFCVPAIVSYLNCLHMRKAFYIWFWAANSAIMSYYCLPNSVILLNAGSVSTVHIIFKLFAIMHIMNRTSSDFVFTTCKVFTGPRRWSFH